MDGIIGPPSTGYAPKGWNPTLWDSFWKLANKMNRQELIVAWLHSIAGKTSEKDFNRNLQDMEKFSKEDMLGIIDEIDPKIARNILEQQYSNL